MNKRWIYFDCDDTLVMWPPHQGKDEQLLIIPDPYRKGATVAVYPHRQHVAYLRKCSKLNKDIIVVWSAGGQPWAEAVVKALGIEDYVSHILAKPDQYVDDLHCTEFMGQHVYKPYGDEQCGLYATPKGALDA